MAKGYEVYLSLDGKTWGKAVCTGEFKNTTSLQKAQLATPTAGRYLKFVAKSEINGNAWTSAAEVGIEAEADVTDIIDVTTDKKTTSPLVFDLQGRRVDNAQLKKGIYIQDGKKTVRR
jgi:hypothetical protein